MENTTVQNPFKTLQKTLPKLKLNTNIQNYTTHYKTIHNFIKQSKQTLQSSTNAYTTIHFTQLYKTMQHPTRFHEKQKLYTSLQRFTQLYNTLHNFTKLYKFYNTLYTTLQHCTKLYKNKQQQLLNTLQNCTKL
jgi:hypothetical protein